MTNTSIPQVAQSHEPQFDPDLEQYVGITLDGHEVFGDSWSECWKKLRGANNVSLSHRQRNGEEEGTQ